MLPAKTGHYVQITEILAHENRSGIIVVRPFDKIIVALQLDTLESFSGNEIGHASNRIRTICGRSTIFKNLYPVERKKWD